VTFDEADLVWSRACDHLSRHGACDQSQLAGWPGDRHLCALLLVHGNVMNGGAGHALIVNTTAEIRTAYEAARYLGLDEIVPLFGDLVQLAVLEEAEESDLSREDRLTKAYYEKAEDDVLEAGLRRKLSTAPGDFSPVKSGM
jgi:hypothetical protein